MCLVVENNEEKHKTKRSRHTDRVVEQQDKIQAAIGYSITQTDWKVENLSWPSCGSKKLNQSWCRSLWGGRALAAP